MGNTADKNQSIESFTVKINFYHDSTIRIQIFFIIVRFLMIHVIRKPFHGKNIYSLTCLSTFMENMVSFQKVIFKFKLLLYLINELLNSFIHLKTSLSRILDLV